MTLKIVGRTPRSLRISEARETASAAKEIAFRCDACGKLGVVTLPYQPNHMERQRIIREALDEHRRIACKAKTAADQRTYEIWYPRS